MFWMFWIMCVSQLQCLNRRLLILRLTVWLILSLSNLISFYWQLGGSSPFRIYCGPSVVLGAEVGGVFGLVWGLIACLIFSVVAPLKLNLEVGARGSRKGFCKHAKVALRNPFWLRPPSRETGGTSEEGKELEEEKDKKTKRLKGTGKHRQRERRRRRTITS